MGHIAAMALNLIDVEFQFFFKGLMEKTESLVDQ